MEETQSLITPFKKDVLSACSLLGPVLGKKISLCPPGVNTSEEEG